MQTARAVAVLVMLLSACSSAQTSPNTYQNATLDWPDELLDSLESSSDAYGWQRCVGTIGTESNDRTGQVRAAGLYDPATDSGLMMVENRRSDGKFLAYRWALDKGVVTTNYFVREGAPGERMSLELLRSIDGLRTLFDFETVTTDVRSAENSKPLVQFISVPDDVDADHRLEGLPSAWPFAWADNEPQIYAAAEALAPLNANSSYSYGTSVLWSLDVWGESTDVERLRFQTQDSLAYVPAKVTELRFVDTASVLNDGDVRLPDCPADLGEGNDDWSGFEGWQATRTVPLEVTLDPQGRPYDTKIFNPDSTIHREVIGELTASAGALYVMDGNAIQIDPSAFASEAVEIAVSPERVDDDGTHHINLEMIWQQDDFQGEPVRQTLGVWVGPTDAAVATWDAFEYAYGTDGGTGGIIAVSALDEAADLGDDYWMTDPDFEAQFELLDLDSRPGTETFTFSNGFGDGGFPLSRGRNAQGDVVAVVIWRTGAPWRLAVPVGDPPPDVTLREENLIECIAGQRNVDPSGRCEFDDLEFN